MSVKTEWRGLQRLRRATDRAKRRELGYGGGLVRKIARRSIRKATKRTRRSAPGQPPRSHTGHLKRGILYAVVRSDYAVIGPTPYGERAAPIIETGGTVTRRYVPRDRKPRRMRYRPRPFMKPALDKALPKIPPHWRNAIRSF